MGKYLLRDLAAGGVDTLGFALSRLFTDEREARTHHALYGGTLEAVVYPAARRRFPWQRKAEDRTLFEWRLEEASHPLEVEAYLRTVGLKNPPQPGSAHRAA